MNQVTPLQAPEETVIARILSGEKELFCDLIKPYERLVYRAVCSLVRNGHDAEDLVQECFLKAFKHLGSFRAESSFKTWLHHIAVNEALQWLRRRARINAVSLEKEPVEEKDYVPLHLSDWREWPSEILERQEVRDEIVKAIAMLPEKYRQVLVCRDINQLSIGDTVELLTISPGTVKIRLLRARLMVRDLLVKALGSRPLTARAVVKRGRAPWF